MEDLQTGTITRIINYKVITQFVIFENRIFLELWFKIKIYCRLWDTMVHLQAIRLHEDWLVFFIICVLIIRIPVSNGEKKRERIIHLKETVSKCFMVRIQILEYYFASVLKYWNMNAILTLFTGLKMVFIHITTIILQK